MLELKVPRPLTVSKMDAPCPFLHVSHPPYVSKNGFGPAFFHTVLWLVNGTPKPNICS